eukprot:SAG22_NODE_8886_length_623_cov_2.263359_1_plen_119_part_10
MVSGGPAQAQASRRRTRDAEIAGGVAACTVVVAINTAPKVERVAATVLRRPAHAGGQWQQAGRKAGRHAPSIMILPCGCFLEMKLQIFRCVSMQSLLTDARTGRQMARKGTALDTILVE